MPLNFESQRKSARNLVLSPKAQTTNNQVITDADLTERQRFDGSASFEETPTRRSDQAMSGKGTQFATEGQETGFDSKFDFKAELDDWLAGYALAFVMGSDTVTPGPPAVHAIEFDETTTQVKMTNIYLEDTADVKAKYPDMAISDVTFTYSDRGAVGVEIGMMGTGRFHDGAMTTLPAVPAAPKYLLNSDTVFKLGPTAGLVDMTGRFMSATLKISRQVINHTAPGAGLYGVMMRHEGWKFSLQANIAAKDTDDIRTLLMNDTLSKLTVTSTTGTSVMAITIPNFKMVSTKIGVTGNMVIWQIQVDESSAYKVGATPALSASVTNSQATAYLLPAS